MGANIDAVSTAVDFGISADRAVTYEADSIGTRMNFDVVSEVVGCVRQCVPIANNWKENIERYKANEFGKQNEK